MSEFGAEIVGKLSKTGIHWCSWALPLRTLFIMCAWDHEQLLWHLSVFDLAPKELYVTERCQRFGRHVVGPGVLKLLRLHG